MASAGGNFTHMVVVVNGTCETMAGLMIKRMIYDYYFFSDLLSTPDTASVFKKWSRCDID